MTAVETPSEFCYLPVNLSQTDFLTPPFLSDDPCKGVFTVRVPARHVIWRVPDMYPPVVPLEFLHCCTTAAAGSHQSSIWCNERTRHAIHIIKIKIHSSCEIEYFVETHLCNLCVILRSRVLRVVCPH